jgi:hypothetical protein
MSNNFKGGRAKRAPYETTHCRIPEPIKSTVESLTVAYKTLVSVDDEAGCKNLLKSTNEAISNLGEREQELNLLRAVLAEAKSKIEKLENEKQFAIDNLLTTFNLKAHEGVKIKEVIAVAIPEIKNYPEFVASDKRRAKK